MSDVGGWILALVAGTGVGLCYFSSLGWTVRRVVTSNQPAPLLLASYTLRSALIIGFLVLMAHWGWVHVVAALLGFLIARHGMLRRFRVDDLAMDGSRSGK